MLSNEMQMSAYALSDLINEKRLLFSINKEQKIVLCSGAFCRYFGKKVPCDFFGVDVKQVLIGGENLIDLPVGGSVNEVVLCGGGNFGKYVQVEKLKVMKRGDETIMKFRLHV